MSKYSLNNKDEVKSPVQYTHNSLDLMTVDEVSVMNDLSYYP